MPEHTLFFRLLAHDDKATALAEGVDAVGEGNSPNTVTHVVDPASFDQVPGSPFAYWVSEALRRKFADLPPLEDGARTVQHGLSTTDDPRFLRTWWEVSPRSLLDGVAGTGQNTVGYEEWCRRRTFEGKRWVAFPKGGEFSPYFADIPLVINWENDGSILKDYLDKKIGKPGQWSRWINAVIYYFRPGITFPKLPHKKGSFRLLQMGCIFSHGGMGLFAPEYCVLSLVALLNSSSYLYLLNILMPRGTAGGQTLKYEKGYVASVPVPLDTASSADLATLALISKTCISVLQDLETYDEVSHFFFLPALLKAKGERMADGLYAWERRTADAEHKLARNQSEADEMAYRLYGIADEDRHVIEASVQDGSGVASDPKEDELTEVEEPGTTEAAIPAVDRRALVADVLSYAVGCAFGRWDVRFAMGERGQPELPDPFASLPVCSPGMLQGDDGLPLRETPAGYPLRIGWDGLLVDDDGHSEDVVRRVREVLEQVWGERAEAIEREACEMLGVREPREYFRTPSGFFADHVKRYSKSRRKAPIYWLLQSPKRSYGLWVYYHRLDRDTLFVALRHYVEPKINGEVTRLREMQAELEAKRAALPRREQTAREKAIDRQEALIAELGQFQAALERVADLGYDPDLHDGVVLNAAPFREVMPWREAKAYWEDLLAGKYAWSTISRRLRARGAIGHGG